MSGGTGSGGDYWGHVDLPGGDPDPGWYYQNFGPDSSVPPYTGSDDTNGAASPINFEQLIRMLLGQPTIGLGQTGFQKNEHNNQSGAKRDIGQIGKYPVGQVDVRTPFMQALELASAPLLLKTLLDPTSLVKQFNGLAGPVPGVPASDLGSFLFGGAGASAESATGLQGGSNTGKGDGGTTKTGTAVTKPTAPLPAVPHTTLANQIPGVYDTAPTSDTGVLNIGGFNVIRGVNNQGQTVYLPSSVGNAGPNLADYIAQLQQQANQIEQNRGVQTRAGGGPLDPNALTLVGERGPELITPGGAGGQQVLPMANLSIAKDGMGGAPQNGFATSPMQGQGTGAIQRLLGQNPEQQAFDTTQNLLLGQGGILGGGNSGNAIMQALQPLFQQNLKFGLNELTNRVPSVYNSGAAIEGADLTSRALNDYNLLGAQALQQGQQNTLGGLGLLGQLAGQAGNGAFNRAISAGGLDTQRQLGFGNLALNAQQQQWNQTVNPTLQLLLAALGMATPTAYQTVVPGPK